MTAPHLGPGHTIAGKYRISALLGFTGEVATYRVAGPHGGELVVKLYDPSIGQRADVMSRLERVHATLATLPEGAVRVIDSGYDLGTGAPFAATELVALPTLAEVCARAPLDPANVVAMLQSLAQVMDAAHAQQLQHHALKPTNVFVAGGVVRVSDFDAAVVRNTSPTHEAYVRSAPWWAPEQLNPSAVLGPATDVFAAALLAFFALTGRSYWLSCQTSPPDLQRWQAEVMAPRALASQRAQELGCVVSPALDVVFERALAVSQSDRPSSIGEMATAFAALAGYRTDTGAKTLAFPEISAADVASFSAAEVRGQPAPFGAYEAPATPHGQQPAHGHQAQPSASVEQGHAIPATAGYGAPEVAPTPGLPPIPLQPKKPKSPLLPIVLGVGAALLVGAAGVTFLFMRSDDPSTDAVASATSDTEDEEPPTSSADTEESETNEAAGGEAPSQPAEPASVKVAVRCAPVACDELWVDGTKLETVPDSIDLSPGTHELKMVAKGHFPRVDKITVAAETPLEKEYRLTPIAAQPRPTPKPCGQFLKPCP